MNIFIIIWILVGLVITLISAFIVGYLDDINDPFDFIAMIAMAAIIWPITVGVALVIAPFTGLYFLGKYIKNHKQ